MSNNPPWIFLRGLMRDQRHWGAFPDFFRAQIPGAAVHTLDLPGNGLLNHLASPASVPALADWVRAELLRRGLKPPYRVFAMSLGAMVAVAWADAAPQEIDACVLVSTSLRPVSPFYQRLRPAAWPLLLQMALGRAAPRATEQSILKLTSAHLQKTLCVLDDWTAWRIAQPVSRSNALRQLLAAMRFSAPRQKPATRLLLLAGAGDALVDARCSKALARVWQCALAEHPSAGHDLPLDDPHWVVQQVRRWLI